ncbi:MAG: 3-isopropylmalate dehydratase small subunit [Kiritimatiellales bacterium]|nr:3-isopropylmalate dehydratase small subunit [Kiritimatiellales bacterium]MCF7863942.1 3-isopropylmalate dehydratase small subunit [Kiritimatiellales bacterium]
MEKFKTFTGVVCAVDRANIDTDALIPKEYLKSIKRTGFGHALFSDWRYNDDGTDKPEFILNQPKTKGASILVGRNNFGCGSSREHAVWAVAQQGFKVVIAPVDGEIPAFADIFRNNCAKNGVLTIQLPSDQVDQIFTMTSVDEPLNATVNLDDQKLIFGNVEFSFEVDPTVKEKLQQGLDDIAESLLHERDITAFEKSHNTQL